MAEITTPASKPISTWAAEKTGAAHNPSVSIATRFMGPPFREPVNVCLVGTNSHAPGA
jgi:hypothetical protein